MSKEKRVFRRLSISSDVSLVHRKRAYPVTLTNISLQGATVESEEKIGVAKGNSCLLRINQKDTDETMDLEALAMYRNDKSIGFQFAENNQKTVQKLHRLIKTNFSKPV